MNHLDAHGLITNRQHAFHKGRSCTTQLCTVIHDCSKTIDQGLQTDMFILDFAKAFDSVPHERLKVKLFRYGINGKTLAWINNFLCQRHQRAMQVQDNAHNSKNYPQDHLSIHYGTHESGICPTHEISQSNDIR